MNCKNKGILALSLAFVLTTPVIRVNSALADTAYRPKKIVHKVTTKKVVKKVAPEQKQIQTINFICTFYTGSADENGGQANAGITATGMRLSRGIMASNNFRFGTQIYIDALHKTYTVQDTGNADYICQLDANTYRIDIYVPTKKEANDLGVIRSTGHIVK